MSSELSLEFATLLIEREIQSGVGLGFLAMTTRLTLPMTQLFFFEERYSQMVGKSYKGWRERARANEKIEKTLAV